MEIASLRALSHLLDEVLELRPAQREAWLAARAGDEATLVPTLRELLKSYGNPDGWDWLEQGPPWAELSNAHDASPRLKDTRALIAEATQPRPKR